MPAAECARRLDAVLIELCQAFLPQMNFVAGGIVARYGASDPRIVGETARADFDLPVRPPARRNVAILKGIGRRRLPWEPAIATLALLMASCQAATLVRSPLSMHWRRSPIRPRSIPPEHARRCKPKPIRTTRRR